MYSKDLNPWVLLPILGTQKIRVWKASEESEESREANRVLRSCTRDDVGAGESQFRLNLAAD